jgi:hypothetical protein
MKEEKFSLHLRTQLCGLLLLWRGLLALEGSVTGSSAAMAMARSLSGSGPLRERWKRSQGSR